MDNSLGRGTTTFFNEAEDLTYVKYKNTVIVKFNRDVIILNSGGWRTYSTKIRMNKASTKFDLGFGVFQNKGSWFVTYKDVTKEFDDDMVILRSDNSRVQGGSGLHL